MKESGFKLTAVLLFGLLLFGCAQNAPAATPTLAATATLQATQAATVAATASATASTADVQEISMTAKQFEFSPSTVTVKKGVPVKITINADDVSHGFSLPDFNVNEQINPGSATIVEFTPDKAGSFTFACSVVCGAGHGSMKGTLVVMDN